MSFNQQSPGFGQPRIASPATFGSAPSVGAQAGPPAQPMPWRTTPRRRRRWPWLVAGALVLAVVAGAVWWFQAQPPDPGPANRTPVVLPATLGGHPFDEEFNFATAEWLELVGDEFYGDDHAFGGASYMSRSARGGIQAPMFNLIVARGYFPEATDIELARAPFTTHGTVTCTNTFEYPDTDTTAGERLVSDNVVLCYRAEQHLTVSVMVIGASKVPRDQIAGAVEEAWAQQ